jgi:hypothetical protein
VIYVVDNDVYEEDGITRKKSAECEVVQTTIQEQVVFTLKPTSQGFCRLSATKEASTNYGFVRSSSLEFEFQLLPQTVTFTSVVPANPVKGGLFEPIATASGDGDISYSIVAGSSCEFSQTDPGKVVFGDPGLCEIRAVAEATGTMESASTTLRIQIGKANQTITFDAIDDRLFSQPMLWLTARTSAPAQAGLVINYESADEAVCKVSPNGTTVTTVKAGICSITASQPGNDQYFAATPVTRIFRILAETPGAPHIVSLSSANQSITVSFKQPSFTGGSEILRYRLEVTSRDTWTNLYINSSCSPVNGTTTCTINGIPNSTELTPLAYAVRVAAVNSAGVGGFAHSRNRISPVETSQAVTDLAGIASPGQLEISWKQPVAIEGSFTRYDIYVWSNEMTPDWNIGFATSVTSNRAIESATISLPELDPFNNMGAADGYTFAVVTISSAHLFPMEALNVTRGEKIGFTTPGIPGLIELTPVGEQLNLGWPAPQTDGGLEILGYEVMVNDEVICSAAGGSDSPNCLTSEQIFAWTGLEAGNTYTFQVGAVNALGVGPMRSISHLIPALPVQAGPGSTTLQDIIPIRPDKPGKRPSILDPENWSPGETTGDTDGDTDGAGTDSTNPSDGSDSSASGSDSTEANFSWLLILGALLLLGALVRPLIRGRKSRVLG